MKGKKLSALLLAGLMAASAVSFTEVIPCKNFTASALSVPIDYTDATSGEFGENLTWSIDSVYTAPTAHFARYFCPLIPLLPTDVPNTHKHNFIV